jgi:hypothetical protein
MRKKRLLLRSKWNKWRFLSNFEELKLYQPSTEPYSQFAVLELINRFNTVFVKPDDSLGGQKVIRLHREEERLIAIYESKKYIFTDIKEFDRWLQTIRENECFLIQQGIDLVTINGSPVDMRTIVQLNEYGKWEVTGMFAKVAKKDSVVTNVHAGGKMVSIEQYLMDAGFNQSDRDKLISHIIDMSIKISEAFSTSYRNVIYALDIGLDNLGKLWMIEINTKPRLDVLKRIDKQMYMRAHHLALINGLNKKSKK